MNEVIAYFVIIPVILFWIVIIYGIADLICEKIKDHFGWSKIILSEEEAREIIEAERLAYPQQNAVTRIVSRRGFTKWETFNFNHLTRELKIK